MEYLLLTKKKNGEKLQPNNIGPGLCVVHSPLYSRMSGVPTTSSRQRWFSVLTYVDYSRGRVTSTRSGDPVGRLVLYLPTMGSVRSGTRTDSPLSRYSEVVTSLFLCPF